MRIYKLCILLAAATLIFCVSQFILEVSQDETWMSSYVMVKTDEEIKELFKDVKGPVLTWWHMSASCHQSWREGVYRNCGQLTCYVTPDERFRDHPDFKGYLFYGTHINWTSLPLPRSGDSIFWALIHEESPRNNIPLVHEKIISLFNYTATFSRHSSVPTTTQFLYDLESLTDMRYFETVEAKNSYQTNVSWMVAPVVYIQTDCSTPPNRDTYVLELAKHIRIDSYGKCLHNRSLPPQLQAPFTLMTMMSKDLLTIVGKYKFALAFENAICEDYVTEKLWRPLITGTVPVYIGSPSVADWLPTDHTAIIGTDFESPKALAEYLHYLNTHDEEYDSYRSHKLQSKVTNERLIKEMKERNYQDVHGISFVKKFECYLCEKAHMQELRKEVSIATTDHYSCELPTSLLTRKVNTTNYWLDNWFNARCEAEVVRRFIDAGVSNYTIEEYERAVKEMVEEKKCSYSEENAKELLKERMKLDKGFNESE